MNVELAVQCWEYAVVWSGWSPEMQNQQLTKYGHIFVRMEEIYNGIPPRQSTQVAITAMI